MTNLIAVSLAGLWLVVPWFVSIAWLAILGVQAGTHGTALRSMPWWPGNRRGWTGAVLTGVLAGASIALAAHAIAGRRPPPATIVDLEFPLRGATYYVANGGSNDLLNAHVQTLTEERFLHYRGQSYGVDIVALNGFGMRAPGVGPRDPRRYVIFGEPIHAPCSGIVLRAEDGRPDLPPTDLTSS